MTARLITTATGTQRTNASSISWEQEMEGPVGAGNVLLAFVGGVDSQKPDPVSATMSGTAVSPMAEVPLTTAMVANGAGHGTFPCGWVFLLNSPTVPAGTVTGTITVEFDEQVGRMQSMSAIISGTSGNFDGAPQIIFQHTQPPDFLISGTHTTTGTNTILIDMCMSESSNHQIHDLGEDQFPFGSVFFSGPKYTISYKDAPTPGNLAMVRMNVGGPFAGVSLITIGLESE